VLFIDEIHRMSPAIEEILYPAMEDYELDIVIGQGPGARSVKVPLQPFTLIGATTRAGLLTSPLRARFGIVHRLDFYSERDIEEIVRRSARILGVPIDGGGGRDRAAGRAARRASPTGCCGACATTRRCGPTARSRTEVARAALQLLEVDEHGFDEVDRRLLRTIIDKFGGAGGARQIAAAISEERDAIEDIYEPFLMQIGFLDRTPRGRVATRAPTSTSGSPRREGSATVVATPGSAGRGGAAPRARALPAARGCARGHQRPGDLRAAARC
jgi:holliday junction DNA helicase RuvB